MLKGILWVAVIAVAVGRTSSTWAARDGDENVPLKEPSPAGRPADKSGYTLFDPTPDTQLRDLNSDRPDVTDSAYTVDAGHVQVESSFAEYTHDVGTGSDGYSVFPTDVRVGVLNNAEADVMVSPFVYEQTRSAGRPRVARGIGDTAVQFRLNLWGDDGGPTALGVIATADLPTARRELGGTGFVQGRLSVPFAAALPADFDLEAMAEFDAVRDDGDSGYGWDVLHSASVEHSIVGPLSGFVEYAGIAPYKLQRPYEAFLDTGLMFALSRNVQLDCAVDFGLSRTTDDFTVVAGITVRL